MWAFDITMGLFLMLTGWAVVKFPLLIAGYNTMSKEQQKKVDIKGASRMMRKTFVLMGLGTMFIPYLLQLAGCRTATGLVPVVIILLGTAYMLFRSRKYTNALNSPDTSVGNTHKKQKAKGFYILAFLTISLLVFFAYGLRPARVTTENEALTISGLYGTALPLQTIDSVTLIESLPSGWRTNGIAAGAIRKGHFNLKGIGKCLLFTQSPDGPFIHITSSGSVPVILNKKTPQQTRELYEKLKGNRNRR